MEAEACIEAVSRGLDAATEALKARDFGRLAATNLALAKSAEKLREQGPNLTLAMLQPLRDRAARQELLLQAAREAVRSALSKQREAERLRTEFSSYGRDGHGRKDRFDAGLLEHRA